MNNKNVSRPPVVAILGHVDHGKTSLLDAIRKSNITHKEHGGITQRIGGYEIKTGIEGYGTDKITFIDTPGHEAFSKLRARGAQVADVALLIIDAKDSLMPQTVESIAHIKAAHIPYIVVLTKIDLPDANPEKVKNDLLKEEVLVEGKGGHTPVIEVSAKTGNGLKELLEGILLLSTENHLSFDPTLPVSIFVIETKKDKRGIVLSCIIKTGTLSVGQTVYSQKKSIKVRSLISDQGTMLKQVVPSMPFELLGAEFEPEVGTLLTDKPVDGIGPVNTSSVKNNKKGFDMQTFLKPEEKEKKLSVVIKADSAGSLEAIKASLAKQLSIDMILTAVGSINNSDIYLAKSTKSIVIGFGMETNQDIKDLGKQEKVVIKTYNIIYELLDELNEVADLLNEKETQETYSKGEAKILAVFVIEGEKVFGVKVLKGKAGLNDKVELYRGQNLIGKTSLISLKIRAKPVEEVKKEQEAGMIFNPPLDIRMGDVVKFIS